MATYSLMMASQKESKEVKKMKTREEKEKIVKELSDSDLLRLHDKQIVEFDPIDDEKYFEFQLVVSEIFRRMTIKEEK